MDYTPPPSLAQSSNRPHPHPYIHDPVLYILNLPLHVTDNHLATTFRYCAPFELNISRDAINHPKQVLSGTIEFESIGAAEKALATLHSRPIQGLRPPAPLTLAPYPPTSPPTLLSSPTTLPRLVRHLPFDFTESKLYDLFRPCGALASVRMHVGIGGSTSGVVEFWNEEDARFADKAMHRFQVENGLIAMAKYDQGLGEDRRGRVEPNARATTSAPPGHVRGTSLRQRISYSSTDGPEAVNLTRTLGQQVHDAQEPRQPKDAMETEGNVLEWDNPKWLKGMLNWELEAEARLVDSRVSKSVESQMGVPISDVFSRSPFDLTGQVTKSGHHPFAKGSYGDIYKGIYRLGDGSIKVAIKTSRMYLQHDQELPKKMKRFRREIIVWWRLKHPNILPFLGTIIDSSTNPDIPAMVCPFAENGALTTYLCERDSKLTIARRLTLVDDVARGLQYLHSQQIVHGDLSGSNVLIDGEGKACIADFGLSTLLTRLGGSTFATTHQAKGTMRWMAPEVLDPDDSHDSKTTPTMESDTYSFGSIMLQILTGKVPYHHLARDEQVVFAIVKGMKHTRPDTDTVTDYRWEFMERCWSPAKASRLRPSSDEIAEFAGKELAKVTTTNRKVKPPTPASNSSTTRPLWKLPAAEFGLARPSTTGVMPPKNHSLDVKAPITKPTLHRPLLSTGISISGAEKWRRPIREQRVGRPPLTIRSLARLPAAEIIKLADTPLVDHVLPKANLSVMIRTDEFIDGLLDKPQMVQRQKVGEKLYHAIKSYGVRGSTRLTVALLDEEDLRALAHLVDSYPSILKEKALIMKASLDGW